MNRRGVDLCETPLFRGILIYSVPIMLTGILQLLFNAADMVVLGQFCGSASLGAVGATNVLITLIIHFFIGFSTGTGVSSAYALGARDTGAVQKIVHTAIPLALAIGAAITLIGVLFSGVFLDALKVPDELMADATLYARLYFAGAIFNLIYNFGASILRAAGNTREPLIYLTIAGVANVLLNLFFVLVLNMSVAGVAIATVISQAISAFLVIRNLCARYDACRLNLRAMRFYKEPLKRILTFGVPAALQSLAFQLSNAVIHSSINSIGAYAVSGMAAGSNIDSFLYTAENAFYQSAMNFIGQNMGARQPRRVTGTLWRAVLSVTVVGLAGGVLIYLFRYPLLSIYLTNSEDAIQFGETRLLFVCLPYFICGVMDVMTGALRGIGSPFVAMAMTLIGACAFRVAWVFTVYPIIGTKESLLISYPVSWVLTAGAEFIAFLILWKKKKQALTPENAQA